MGSGSGSGSGTDTGTGPSEGSMSGGIGVGWAGRWSDERMKVRFHFFHDYLLSTHDLSVQSNSRYTTLVCTIPRLHSLSPLRNRTLEPGAARLVRPFDVLGVE